jgi:hypothetical protein
MTERQDDMGRALVPRYLATLDFSKLTDDEVHVEVGNIKAAAATSSLVQANPPMAASVAALVAKDATFVVWNKTVSDDKVKLRSDTASEALSRAEVLGELRSYATYASNFAKSPADLHGAGVAVRAPRPPRNTTPPVPETIDTKPPKKGHGKIVVLVHETGSTRHQYVAEQSVDGVNWVPLGVGRGKTRTLTGVSGAKIWVRFATVRGTLTSEWSTAALVQIP